MTKLTRGRRIILKGAAADNGQLLLRTPPGRARARGQSSIPAWRIAVTIPSGAYVGTAVWFAFCKRR